MTICNQVQSRFHW